MFKAVQHHIRAGARTDETTKPVAYINQQLARPLHTLHPERPRQRDQCISSAGTRSSRKQLAAQLLVGTPVIPNV